MSARTDSDYVTLIEAMPPGAVLSLQGVAWDEYENLLRQLASDSDLEVRGLALAILNDRLRDSLSVRPRDNTAVCHVEMGRNRARKIQSVSFVGDVLIVAYSNRVRAFHSQTRRAIWT